MDTLRGDFEPADLADEPFDLTDSHDADDETGSDAGDPPPSPVGQDERRMQVRAYNFWASLLQDSHFPSIEDLNPEELPDFGPFSVLLDFTQGIENPAIKYLGDKLAIECDIPAATAQLDDVPSLSLLSRITDHYMQILANQAPIGFEAEFVNQRDATILYRGILLPFSSDDDTIDFIYGVINWKEIADQLTSDELLLEIDQALDEAPAPDEAAEPVAEEADEPVLDTLDTDAELAEPVLDTGEADWADGPGEDAGHDEAEPFGDAAQANSAADHEYEDGLPTPTFGAFAQTTDTPVDQSGKADTDSDAEAAQPLLATKRGGSSGQEGRFASLTDIAGIPDEYDGDEDEEGYAPMYADGYDEEGEEEDEHDDGLYAPLDPLSGLREPDDEAADWSPDGDAADPAGQWQNPANDAGDAPEPQADILKPAERPMRTVEDLVAKPAEPVAYEPEPVSGEPKPEPATFEPEPLALEPEPEPELEIEQEPVATAPEPLAEEEPAGDPVEALCADAGEPAGLYDCLAAARELADIARNREDRSRTALYAAVGRAYDVSLAAEAAPDEFAELLEDNGLTQQERAPLTPVVKLVFGADYDKTRVTEYATVLGHAHRVGIERGELARFLDEAEGGLKAVVATERRIRREEKGETVRDPDGLPAKLVRELRALEPRSLEDIASMGEEFGVVMIRRLPSGEVVLLGEVADDRKLTERVARIILR